MALQWLEIRKQPLIPTVKLLVYDVYNALKEACPKQEQYYIVGFLSVSE